MQFAQANSRLKIAKEFKYSPPKSIQIRYLSFMYMNKNIKTEFKIGLLQCDHVLNEHMEEAGGDYNEIYSKIIS